MKVARILAGTVVLALFACSSTSSSVQDRGLEGEGVGAATTAPDTNPDGVPYPTDNIGTSERTGTRAGNRIANFKFLGYPDGDPSQGLQPLSLAQYFDPTGTKYRIVHIQATGVWCQACMAETKVVVTMKSELEARGAVWLVSVAEGPTPGTPSKQKDMDGWIAEFKSPFTHFLDPNNANLGPFYDRTALPWNANIDARTMEILTSDTGAVTTKDAVLEEIDLALDLAKESRILSPQ